MFRVDSSHSLGYGHVYRCLAVADAIKQRGGRALFICGKGKSNEVILNHGHHLRELTSTDDASRDATETLELLKSWGDVDWILVDHYGLDVTWESQLTSRGFKLGVIDDLADRTHECDLLLDQTLGRTYPDYRALVPARTRLLLGAKYCLLRSEFSANSDRARAKREEEVQVPHILVSMGGTDPHNVTQFVLAELAVVARNRSIKVTVLLGQGANNQHRIEDICRVSPFEARVIVGSDCVSSLMIEADIAVGAAGTSTWERCTMGLPTLMVVCADNQVDVADAMTRNGAALNMGYYPDVPEGRIWESVEMLIQSPDRRRLISSRCFDVCDGRGTGRLLDELAGLRANDE